MILVTVGTEQYPFNALLDWVGALMQAGFIAPEEEVVVQYGACTRFPDRVKIYQRLPESEFKALVAQARLVIAHCGEGTALLLKTFNVPYVLVPRTQRWGEHVDNHQLEMAAALEKQGVAIARSPADLIHFLATPTTAPPPLESDSQLCRALTQLCPPTASRRMMLVCSSGGHFKAMQELRAFWSAFAERTWVTFRTRATESELTVEGDWVHWAFHPTNRNLPNLVRNLVLAVGVLRQERPDVVVSTGAGVAVPFLLLAKLLYGSTVVFVESKTRLQKLSLSALLLRICGALDHLIVQAPALAALYPEAVLVDSSGSAAATETLPAQFSSPASIKGKPDFIGLHDSLLVSAPTLEGRFNGAALLEQVHSACALLSPPTLLSPQVLPAQIVVVDMQAVQSIDSAGLDALMRLWRQVKTGNGQLVLWSVPPRVMAVLMRARFDRLLRIDPATAAVRQASSPPAVPTGATTVVPQSSWRRAVDIGVALAGLGVTTVALLPIAIAIKLESPGPIFTREMCCGYMGQQFSTWKFRTSRVPDTTTSPSAAATQLTQVGKVLHYLRLDKLPLFWNVLVGEMRLTGGYAPRSSGL